MSAITTKPASFDDLHLDLVQVVGRLSPDQMEAFHMWLTDFRGAPLSMPAAMVATSQKQTCSHAPSKFCTFNTTNCCADRLSAADPIQMTEDICQKLAIDRSNYFETALILVMFGLDHNTQIPRHEFERLIPALSIHLGELQRLCHCAR